MQRVTRQCFWRSDQHFPAVQESLRPIRAVKHTCDVNKFDGDLYTLIRLCGKDPEAPYLETNQATAAAKD